MLEGMLQAIYLGLCRPGGVRNDLSRGKLSKCISRRCDLFDVERGVSLSRRE